MPDWPRTIKPSRQTIPRFPGAASSWGGSGKGQTRDLIAAGRIWEEWYPILEYDDEDARALITTINDYWRNGTSFDIENYLLNTPNGVGGGTPTPKKLREASMIIAAAKTTVPMTIT